MKWPINIKNADILPYWKKSSPVRISRSYKLNGDFSEFALAKGICYNDLYRLVCYWPETGQQWFIVWRYKFHRDGSKSIHWKLEGKKIEKLGLVMYDSGGDVIKDSKAATKKPSSKKKKGRGKEEKRKRG